MKFAKRPLWIVISVAVLAVILGGCTSERPAPVDSLPGSDGTGSGGSWAGGPVQPTPGPTVINPSAAPVGDTIPTGIVVKGHEMILYFWGAGANLNAGWRNVTTGEIQQNLPGSDTEWAATPSGGAFLRLIQENTGGLLIEYGAVRGKASRVVSEDQGVTVEAQFTAWSKDPSVTVFWLRRTGAPIPANSPFGDGRLVPVEPEKYPLVTVYGTDGVVLASARLRPVGTQHVGG